MIVEKSDYGVAQYISDNCLEGYLFYNPPADSRSKGYWCRRNGVLTVTASQNEVRDIAIDGARSLYEKIKESTEVPDEKGERRDEAVRTIKFFSSYRNAAKIRQIVFLLTRFRCFSDAEIFDSPMTINTLSGPVDLRTGKLLPPDDSRIIRKSTTCEYDPDACSEEWEAALCQILVDKDGNPCPEYVEFFQRLAGYWCFEGEAEEKIFFANGDGANGKNTAIEPIDEVLGYDYSIKTSASGLLEEKGYRGGPNTYLANCAGRRLVWAGETRKGLVLDAEMMKRLTGDGKIAADDKFEKQITFKPTSSFIFNTNHLPHIIDYSEGMLRRPMLLPFYATFKGSLVKKGLKRELRDNPKHHTGILAWLVRGAVKYHEQGLGKCEIVEQATAEWIGRETVSVARFLETEVVKTGRTSADDLRDTFSLWAKAKGNPLGISDQKFGREIRKAGIEAEKSYGVMHYCCELRNPNVVSDVEREKLKAEKEQKRQQEKDEKEKQMLIDQNKMGLNAWIKRESGGDSDFEMFLREEYSKDNRERLLRKHEL